MRVPIKTPSRLDRQGFTLIELVIIIVILGVLATVAIPKFSSMSESSKVTATKQEMRAIKRAIVGNPQVVAGGQLVDRGFEGDVGFAPNQIGDIVVKPGSLSVYNQLTRLGWNGPYMDAADNSYLSDAWEQTYVYDLPGRRLISTGGTDSIIVTF